MSKGRSLVGFAVFILHTKTKPIYLLTMAAQVDRVLLPKHIAPVRHQLQITPNLVDFTFLGKEKIEVNIKNETDEIVLHCVDIKVCSNSFGWVSSE
jgi:hypothetical protein